MFSLLLTGCAGGSRDPVQLDPKNPVTVEIWHYYNGPQKTAFDELVSQFNEGLGREKGIVVEAFSQGSVNELIAKVIETGHRRPKPTGLGRHRSGSAAWRCPCH